METQNSKRASVSLKIQGHQNGSALILIVISLFVLSALGVGMLTVGYGARLKAIRLKNEVAAMLAAEAGYEQAIFWMSQQPDMLSALQDGVSGTSGTLNFPDGECTYQIGFFAFLGARPVYRVTSSGQKWYIQKDGGRSGASGDERLGYGNVQGCKWGYRDLCRELRRRRNN